MIFNHCASSPPALLSFVAVFSALLQLFNSFQERKHPRLKEISQVQSCFTLNSGIVTSLLCNATPLHVQAQIALTFCVAILHCKCMNNLLFSLLLGLFQHYCFLGASLPWNLPSGLISIALPCIFLRWFLFCYVSVGPSVLFLCPYCSSHLFPV